MVGYGNFYEISGIFGHSAELPASFHGIESIIKEIQE
jgi:hypothetical protein